MLFNPVQNRQQSSAQHLAKLSGIHDSRRITKAVALALPGLLFIFFGETCNALENGILVKNLTVTVSRIYSGFHPTKLQHTLWWQIANRHQLAPYILYAVALVESAKHNDPSHITPWPWAINKSGKAIIPASQDDNIYNLNLDYLILAHELIQSGRQQQAMVSLGLTPEAVGILAKMPVDQLKALARSDMLSFAPLFPVSAGRTFLRNDAVGSETIEQRARRLRLVLGKSGVKYDS